MLRRADLLIRQTAIGRQRNVPIIDSPWLTEDASPRSLEPMVRRVTLTPSETGTPLLCQAARFLDRPNSGYLPTRLAHQSVRHRTCTAEDWRIAICHKPAREKE